MTGKAPGEEGRAGPGLRSTRLWPPKQCRARLPRHHPARTRSRRRAGARTPTAQPGCLPREGGKGPRSVLRRAKTAAAGPEGGGRRGRAERCLAPARMGPRRRSADKLRTVGPPWAALTKLVRQVGRPRCSYGQLWQPRPQRRAQPRQPQAASSPRCTGRGGRRVHQSGAQRDASIENARGSRRNRKSPRPKAAGCQHEARTAPGTPQTHHGTPAQLLIKARAT